MTNSKRFKNENNYPVLKIGRLILNLISLTIIQNLLYKFILVRFISSNLYLNPSSMITITLFNS